MLAQLCFPHYLHTLSATKTTNAVKQVITFVLIALILIVVIPMMKRSIKFTPALQALVGETFTVTFDSSADPASRWDLLANDETKVQLLDYLDAKEAIAETEIWTFKRSLARSLCASATSASTLPTPLRHVPTQSR